jgi:hypothetical protein
MNPMTPRPDLRDITGDELRAEISRNMAEIHANLVAARRNMIVMTLLVIATVIVLIVKKSGAFGG